MTAATSRSERVYAALIRVLPRAFRQRFGQPMRDHFHDRLHARRETLATLWLRTIADLAVTSAIEWRSELATRRPARPLTRTDFMRSVLEDIRYAARILRNSPVFAGVAIVVLALGTGAVSTMFSVANAILLRPLPGIADPHALVWVHRTGKGGDGSVSASWSYYRHLAENAKQLEGIAAWSEADLTVRAPGKEARGAYANMVSGNFFDVLGARPALGRFFTREEGTVESLYPVVVVSQGFWKRELSGDSSAVGRTVLVNGSPYTVVGVAEPGFSGLYPILRTDVWVTTMARGHLRSGEAPLDDPRSAWLELIARPRDGVSLDLARAELSTLTAQYAESEPAGTPWRGLHETKIGRWTGLPPDASAGIAAFLTLLLAVAGMVLLIASINVASMLLARGVVRSREIAIRLAIGAGAGRLSRQLLTESLVLFVLGGGLGIGVAVAGTRLLGAIELPVDVPLQLDVAPDVNVLAFTLVVALLTGIVFGLAPAVRATRLDLNISLRGDSAGGGRRKSRMRSGLIVTQVALSLVLLVAAGLFTRSLGRGRAVDIGFDTADVVTAALNTGSVGYDSIRARRFYDALAERLNAIPAIDTVGYTRMLPLSMSSMGTSISMPDVGPPGGRLGTELNVSYAEVDGGYFAAVRMPIVSGRGFTLADRRPGSRGVIVNERFVRQYFPGGNAIGHIVRMSSERLTVVGVAKDSKYRSLDEPLDPFMYLPSGGAGADRAALLVRSSLPTAEVASLIRREVRAIDANYPLPTITTLSKATAVVLLPQRAAAAVTGMLGALGLLMAAIGLYGVIAFSTAQRTREMGVRLALGARPADLRRMIVGEGMKLVGIGSAIGFVLALAATRAMIPFLFGLDPLDPATFLAIAVVLGVSAWIASWVPARRAAAADPMTSLRRE